MVGPGGMHGWSGGCTWFFWGGHAWFLLGGVCVFFQGACMVFSGGVCVVFSGGACVGYDEIRSMSGQYASYWNAFLSHIPSL